MITNLRMELSEALVHSVQVPAAAGTSSPVHCSAAQRRDVLPLLGREKMQFLNIATLHMLDSIDTFIGDTVTANVVMARPGPGCGDWRK